MIGNQRAEPNYVDEITSSTQDTGPIPGWTGAETGNSEEQDELYDEAVNFVIESRRASISAVQRKLRIGYNRAARLIETMEEAGLVSEMSSNGSREVLVPKRDWFEIHPFINFLYFLNCLFQLTQLSQLNEFF